MILDDDVWQPPLSPVQPSVTVWAVGDDLPRHPATTFDDDAAEGWWGGVFLRGVQIVLAAALAVSAQAAVARTQWTYDEQVPAGNLHQPANEDYWQNPTAPIPRSFYQNLPLGDPELVPAGNLHKPANEDYWQNPIPPVPRTFYQPLPYLPDPEEIPAGKLRGQLDEDFWPQQLLPAPVPLTFGELYLPDPDEIPAGSLFGQPDEDFWPQQLLPAPVAASLGGLYLPDPEEIPAGKLQGQYDEDFWQNPVAPVWSYPVRLFTDDDVVVPQPIIFSPDEDFWFNAVFPAQLTFWQAPFAVDPDFVGFIPDEDFWPQQLLPVPIPASLGKLYLPDPEEIPAGNLKGQADEDFWINWVAPVPLTFYQPLPLIDPEELLSMLEGQPDEDFWQNPAAPVPATLVWPQQWWFDEQSPSLFGQFDEDLWINPVAPVAATFWQPLPITADPDFVGFVLDEDFWSIPLHSVSSNFGQLYLPDPTDSITELATDEDYWQNPVAPVPSTLQWPQQWTFDVQEPAGSLFGQHDEDFNWLTMFPFPVQASMYQRLPYAPDVEELPAGSLRIMNLVIWIQ